MKKISDPALFNNINAFITIFLPKVRSRSKHTIQSYKDAINGFTMFLKDAKNIELAKVKTEHFNSENILSFLEWLKTQRGNADSTINHRLMSLRSFCNYLAGENAVQFDTYAKIRQIQKIPTPEPAITDVLSIGDIKFLLGLIDTSKKTGLRDRFYIAMIYDLGCRNSELLDLVVGGIRINKDSAHVNLIGKGQKPRTTPLSREMIGLVDEYLSLYHPDKNPNSYLFYTKRNGIVTQMSPDNVARFMNVYEEKAKALRPNFIHIHPHIFRHSRAMHLYQAGMPLPLVGQWLGHSQQETTLIYAHADTEMKKKAGERLMRGENSVFTNEPFIHQDDDATIRKLYGLG